MTIIIQSDERLPRLLNSLPAFTEKTVSQRVSVWAQESWATFPDPLSFPMGTDKNQGRQGAVLCS